MLIIRRDISDLLNSLECSSCCLTLIARFLATDQVHWCQELHMAKVAHKVQQTPLKTCKKREYNRIQSAKNPKKLKFFLNSYIFHPQPAAHESEICLKWQGFCGFRQQICELIYNQAVFLDLCPTKLFFHLWLFILPLSTGDVHYQLNRGMWRFQRSQARRLKPIDKTSFCTFQMIRRSATLPFTEFQHASTVCEFSSFSRK